MKSEKKYKTTLLFSGSVFKKKVRKTEICVGAVISFSLILKVISNNSFASSNPLLIIDHSKNNESH